MKLITNDLIRFFYNFFYNDNNQITDLAGMDVLSYSHIYEEDMYTNYIILKFSIFMIKGNWTI